MATREEWQEAMPEQEVRIFICHEGWIPAITMWQIPRIGETICVKFKDKNAECTVKSVVWKQTENNNLRCDFLRVEFECFG